MKKALLLACCALALCAPASRAVTPALVQNCFKSNGGVATQNYTVTIAGSGGTTGCNANFTAGDMFAVGYFKNSGADLTTAAMSATGATITWHKGPSINDTTYGIWVGVMYACASDITSPTNSIAVTANMGSTMTGVTSIFLGEMSGILPTGCQDPGASAAATGMSCCFGSPFGTNLPFPMVLSHNNEMLFVVGTSFGSASAPTITSGCFYTGTCPGGGALTIPANGTTSETSGFVSTTAIETGNIVNASSTKPVFFQSPAAVEQDMVALAFLTATPPQGYPRVY